MKFTLWMAGITAAGLLTSGAAQALLIDRGGGLIYDNVLNITWLQDANLAASNTFGLAYNTNLGNHPDDRWAANYNEVISTNGRMTWGAALHWIDAMNAANYLGYDDWRLPTMIDTGSSLGCTFAYSGTDCGYNVQTVSGATVYSEMAYMYYVNLGNKGYYNTSGNSQSGYGLVNDPLNPNDESLFTDLQSYGYWSGLENARYVSTSYAWYFETNGGSQSSYYKFNASYAWAVRPGDVAAAPAPSGVPEPATVGLLALGLLGFGMTRRRGVAALRASAP